MFSLQTLCNAIVLVGAVIIAIKNIYHFFKKPVTDLQEKANTKEEKHIEEIIQKKVPELLIQHGQNVAESRRLEDQKRDAAIKSSIIDAIDIKINELKMLNNDIQSSLKALNMAQLNTMRYNLDSIYTKYFPYKKITAIDKQAFIKMYEDYKTMGGNTWVDTLYNELINWETIQVEEDLHN